MKAIFLLILSSVMFVGVGEAQVYTPPGLGGESETQETQPIAETPEEPELTEKSEPQTACDHTNYEDYIFRDQNDESKTKNNEESEPIKCDLSRQIFSYGDWQYANFSNADFSFSDVLYVDMRQTILRDANLHYTIFQYVNFSFADLRGAIFSQTVFFMSDFTGTLVTSEQADYLIERGISGFVVMEL